MASAPGKGRRQDWSHRGRCGGACPGEERTGTEPWSWPQNIHLVARWLSALDKKLERFSVGSHDDYRVFISAEPAPSPESHIIPQGVLENAIKITNEPPTGMYANLHKALDLFTQVGRPPNARAGRLPCYTWHASPWHYPHRPPGRAHRAEPVKTQLSFQKPLCSEPPA